MALEKIEFENGKTPASAETMNALQENIENEFERIAPVTLYESNTGTTGTVTLSESIEDFDYIKIFYEDQGDNSRNSRGSVDVHDANGTYVNAKIVAPVRQSSNRLRIVLTTYYISSDTISPIDYLVLSHENSTTTYYGVQNIKIMKVLGYKI